VWIKSFKLHSRQIRWHLESPISLHRELCPRRGMKGLLARVNILPVILQKGSSCKVDRLAKVFVTFENVSLWLTLWFYVHQNFLACSGSPKVCRAWTMEFRHLPSRCKRMMITRDLTRQSDVMTWLHRWARVDCHYDKSIWKLLRSDCRGIKRD